MRTIRRVLTRHTDTPGAPVRRVEASACAGEILAFKFVLEGDLARLRIPRRAPSRPADGLWKHTCFEAFVKPKGELEYLECNFSPSREWAIHRFRAYREGMMPITAAPEIDVQTGNDRLELHATIRLDCLTRTRLALALCAVIEDENGALSYWALNHPPGKPDFHHPSSFALEVRNEAAFSRHCQ